MKHSAWRQRNITKMINTSVPLVLCRLAFNGNCPFAIRIPEKRLSSPNLRRYFEYFNKRSRICFCVTACSFFLRHKTHFVKFTTRRQKVVRDKVPKLCYWHRECVERLTNNACHQENLALATSVLVHSSAAWSFACTFGCATRQTCTSWTGKRVVRFDVDRSTSVLCGVTARSATVLLMSWDPLHYMKPMGQIRRLSSCSEV